MHLISSYFIIKDRHFGLKFLDLLACSVLKIEFIFVFVVEKWPKKHHQKLVATVQ